jgi:hypothetical protein
MQSLNLLGLQRDYRVAPTETDIRMMAFSFREFTNLLNKGKRLPEIAKPEAPLDAVSFLQQLPVWGLRLKEFSLLAREWRYSPATGSTGFVGKSLGHVACPSCKPSPALTRLYQLAPKIGIFPERAPRFVSLIKGRFKSEAVNALLRSIGGVVDRLEITDQRFENMSDASNRD